MERVEGDAADRGWGPVTTMHVPPSRKRQDHPRPGLRHRVLDVLARRVTPSGGTVTGIDSDRGHIAIARSACSQLGLDDRVDFIVGEVAEVLRNIHGPVDAVYDDAWFATAPPHLDTMVGVLRPGGLLTMPNWFLLVDALTGTRRKEWEKFAVPTWAADAVEYADELAARPDLAVS
jgi:predicted O-methyltransferase YrrM